MSPLSSILSRGKDVDGAEYATDDAVATDYAPAPAVAVRVNLLPPEIAEAAAFRRGQVVRAGAVAAAVALIAGATVVASGSVSDAEEQLAAEQARSAQLQTQVAALADVPATELRLQTAREQLRGAMGAEVNWATYLNAIGVKTPAGIAFTDVSITQAVDPAPTDGTAGSGSEAPKSLLGTPGIATVTFTGQAATNDHIAKFLERLDYAKIGNVDPYFTSATTESDADTGQEAVNFTATVTVTDTAKTLRFLKEGI
jgi:hypothetical protein